jgi:signal transduction histidine kinase/ligand-binding sensor domain-containing protein
VLSEKVHVCYQNRGKVIYCLILLLCVNVSLAASPSALKEQILVNQYNVEDGLNQSMVTCFYSDIYGLKWIGTGSGLNYFDGNNLYYAQISNQERQNQSIIRQIDHWDSNYLLICTAQEIGLLNRVNFEFKTLYYTERSEPVLLWSSKKIHLFWSLENGFFALFKTAFGPFLLPWDSLSELVKEEPKNFIITADNQFLISLGSGVLNVNRDHEIRQLLNSDYQPTLLNNSDNETYVISKNKIYQFRNNELKLAHTTHLERPSCAVFSKKGDLWVFDSELMGLFRFDRAKTNEVRIIKQFRNQIDTLVPIVKFVKFDEHDNLIIGTDGAGFLTTRLKQFDFNKSLIGFTSTIAASANYVWAGTVKNGLWRMNHELKECQRLTNEILDEHCRILYVHVDNKNRLWVLTMNELSVYNENLDILFIWKPEESDIMQSGRIIEIDPDTIFLNISRSSNFKAYSQTIVFDNKNEPRVLEDFSQDDLIVAIKKINQRYWIAGRKGLYVNNHPNLIGAKKINTGVYFSLCEYKNGVLASSKAGFEFYNLSFEFIDSFILNGINKVQKIVPYGLAKDKHDRLWFSSNIGLGYIVDDSIHLFDKSFNLQSIEFASSAFFSNDQYIYFGGVSGINVIDPKKFHDTYNSNYQNNTVLIQLFINNKSLFTGLAANGQQIRMKQYSDFISGDVASINRDWSELNQYSFFLKNYDLSWSNAKNSGSFEYGKLPSGDYTLFVRTKNAYGYWDEPTELLSIHVPTFFYQRWWFIGFCLVAVLLFTSLLVRLYQKRKFNLVIEAMNRQRELDLERLRIARDVHDELGGGLSKMLVISQLMTKKQNDSNSIKELSSDIKETCTDLLKNLSDVVWSLKNETLSLSMFQAKTSEIAADLLENTDIQYNIKTQGELSKTHCCSNLMVKNFFPAFKEALTNIIKHAAATQVDILLEFDTDKVSLTIEDNGCGIADDVKLGNGLRNMQHRMEICSGEFILKRKKNKGTILIFKNLSLEKI